MSTQIDIHVLHVEQGRAEHVALEGEPIAPIHPIKQPHRIARDRYRLRSWLHGCNTELTLLEGHHLRVNEARSGGRSRKYELDLRYVPFSELVNPDDLRTDVRLIEPGSDFHRLARFLETRVDRLRDWAPGRRIEK